MVISGVISVAYLCVVDVRIKWFWIRKAFHENALHHVGKIMAT